MNASHGRIARRGFLKAAGAAAAAPYVIPSTALGAKGVPAASDRIALGIIGTANIGMHHIHASIGFPDARIVAVCDPFLDRRRSAQAFVNARYGDKGCTEYRDFRDLIARDDVDAVYIGTPDHWHAVQGVLSMKAGKDVYVQKPLTHTIAEGRVLADTAKACGRVFQTGIQQRSDWNFRFACELVRNGRVGRLEGVKVGVPGINGGVQTNRDFPTAPVPEGLDYDLWLGPAPVKPYTPNRVERGDRTCYWYYISDYTIGFISGWGVHHVDIAQWGLGTDRTGPVEVQTLSADIPRDGLVDDAVAWHADVLYANGIHMSFSSNGAPNPQGIRFEGDEGWVFVRRGYIDAHPKSLLKSTIAPEEIHLYESPGHHRNFLDCIRTRKPTAADAEIGHRATTTCNLVEISARLGRKVKWDPAKERFFAGGASDDAANRMLSRAKRSPWAL